MKASVVLAGQQPSFLASNLAIGQGVQLPSKETIVRLGGSVWLNIAADGTPSVFTALGSLPATPGDLIPAGSSVSLTL